MIALAVTLAVALGTVYAWILAACIAAKRADDRQEGAVEQWARESNEHMVRYEDRQRVGL